MPDILTDRKTGKQFILGADVPTGTVTPPTPRYTVTITGGYLDDDPAKTAGSYLEGSSVIITAAPPAGKQFSHFVIEGGSSVSSSPATIIVTRNMIITAMFEDAVDTGKLAGTWRANSVTTGGTEMRIPMQSTWIAKCGYDQIYNFDFVDGKFKAQINSAGTHAIVFVDTNTRERDRTEDIIFYDYADEQIAEYKEALLANMMQFYTKIN